MTDLKPFAKYYLVYTGRKGTEKQIEQLLCRTGESIIRMAVERGYKVPQ